MNEIVWDIQKHDRAAAAALGAELRVHPLTAALLIARGHGTPESASRFLEPKFEHLHDPDLLFGLDKAVERVLRASDAGEKVLIWGDYDVDGTTGTVVLRKTLELLGIPSEFHIPNRFTEGYGVNIPALQAAKERGCSLVITVDCGSRSFEPIDWARENGMDVIVTDHHLSDETRGNPNANSVVNPNQAECSYPDKSLAGVGVAYKLSAALLRKKGLERLSPSFLKIAAIGTVADMMDLSGENRAIVALGLRDLPNTSNYGLKALMEVSDCRSDMTSYHIGFRIAPRINAAGRMDVARHVVELFEATDFNEARRLAELLDSRNRERQKIQAEITELALNEAAARGDRMFVVVAGEGWHRGVIGLAASRIADKLCRPVIVFSIENGVAHGSGRSRDGFHLLDALGSCGDLFEQFGGHAAAAGMKIPSDRIPELSDRLDAHARECISAEDLIPRLRVDAKVSAASMNLGLLDEIARLEPFGIGNPKPVFATDGLFLRFDPTVMKEKHLKLYLQDNDGRRFEAVWWDGVEKGKGRTLRPGTGIELAYTPEANKWQGNTRLQLVVEDLKEHN
jgi:single-stranded-DNA-specific exonuclease